MKLQKIKKTKTNERKTTSNKNKKEAIDKIAAEKYNNFPSWQYIGTFKQFENIIRKQKDIEYYIEYIIQEVLEGN